MEISEIEILIRLLIAHFLADYTFQPDKWVKSKKEDQLTSPLFYAHIAIVGITAYVFLWNWSMWYIALIITITHLLIDIAKIKLQKDNLTVFLADQFLHIGVIILCWLSISNQFGTILPFIGSKINNTTFWLIALGYLLNTLPLGILIGFLTKKWTDELKINEELEEEQTKVESGENSEEITVKTSHKAGLTNAGRSIGMLERILIFTFIIIGKEQAVGFLIAAKSVFRFGDINNVHDRKKTEYILIGTLFSFTFSFMVGFAIKKLLEVCCGF